MFPLTLLSLAFCPLNALAQSAASGDTPETVIVTATTPLPGTGIDVDKLPSNIQTLSAADLTREGSASLTSGFNSQLGSVSINDDLGSLP
jgi:hypothetical protein